MKTALAIILTLTANNALAREQYPGQYAQVPQAERDWFKSQRSPANGVPCCDQSDGTYAEEQLRGDEYWTRFTWKRCVYQGRVLGYTPEAWSGIGCEDVVTDWVQVPPDVVIHNPNRHGAPVVWYLPPGGEVATSTNVHIRCYAPGAGA